jgi:hypothetical protein
MSAHRVLIRLNLAVSALIAAFAANKGIVDESAARAAVAEASTE